MNERIDHAAKARTILAELEQMDPRTEWGEIMQKQLSVTAHIGLASVEQQRIANLIAASEYAWRRWGNYAPPSPVFEHGPDAVSNMRYSAQIREGLGL